MKFVLLQRTEPKEAGDFGPWPADLEQVRQYDTVAVQIKGCIVRVYEHCSWARMPNTPHKVRFMGRPCDLHPLLGSMGVYASRHLEVQFKERNVEREGA